MAVSYTIDLEMGLIRETLRGSVDLEEGAAYFSARLDDPQVAATRCGLLDLRNAHLDYDSAALHAMSELYRQNDARLHPRHWAILSDTPREVALVMMLIETWTDLGMQVAVFNTEEAARKFLNLPA